MSWFSTRTTRSNRTAALLALAGLALVACSRESAPQTLSTAATTPATTASATSAPTTAPVTTAPSTSEPVTPTTGAPPTSAAPASPTTAPVATPTTAPTQPPPTTSPSPAPVPTDVTASLWIAGVEEGDPEVTSDGVNCLGFYEATGATTYSACGEWNAVGGRRVWTVTKGAADRFFAVIWQEISPFDWVPRLRLLEPEPNIWSAVTLRATDIDGGPNEELVSGIRYVGTGDFLDVDVIDVIGANPQVVGHVDGIDKAVAYTEDNAGVRIWDAEFGPEDPGCCPSSYTSYLLESGVGGWVLTETTAGLTAADIPLPSQF